MAAKPPIRRISQWDMYRLFNEGHYHRRLLAGEFQAVIEDQHAATIVSQRIPVNSQSGEVFYYEGQDLVAIVHCFVTEAGEIAASGKHDPRRLIINGVVYRRRKANDLDTSRLANREINAILQKKDLAAALTYLWWLVGIWQKFWKLRIRDPILVPLGLAEKR